MFDTKETSAAGQLDQWFGASGFGFDLCLLSGCVA